MNQIPCKEDKCLKYPICLQKKQIKCGYLLNWFREEDKRYRQSPWGKLDILLPKLQHIDDFPAVIFHKGVASL